MYLPTRPRPRFAVQSFGGSLDGHDLSSAGEIDAIAAEILPGSVKLGLQTPKVIAHLCVLRVPGVHHLRPLVFLGVTLPQHFPVFFQIQAFPELWIGQVRSKSIFSRLLLLWGHLTRLNRLSRRRRRRWIGSLRRDHRYRGRNKEQGDYDQSESFCINHGVDLSIFLQREFVRAYPS